MKRGSAIVIVYGGVVYRATVIAMRDKGTKIQYTAPRGLRRSFGRWRGYVTMEDYGGTWVRPADEAGVAALESIARLS